MTFFVQPRLVNGPFDDPGLILDFRFGRRAILFDLGDLGALSSRELLRVSHVFVSHTHMDHFAGFDRLLRVCLHRPARLTLVGPPGFADRIEHRLRSYVWNLLGADSAPFAILAADFDGAGFGEAALFEAQKAFAREPCPVSEPAPGVLLEEDAFRVEGRLLDHRTPCLAFAFQERLRVNVWREGLDRLGLPVGPWLEAAKAAVRRGDPDDRAVAIPGGTVLLGELRPKALRVAPGQRIAYVVDCCFEAANRERILELAAGADQLFIETAFLEADAALAAEKCHLTARQAGALARLAGAGRLTPLHFSARYMGREGELVAEAADAFGGPVGR